MARFLIGDRRPVIRSDYDVYLIENSLIYVKEQCGEGDVDAPFFLHLDPVDADNLPAHRKQYGFDNFDFNFDSYGMRLGGACLADVALPGYAIAAIRTGQYVHVEGGFDNTWEGEFKLRRRREGK